MFQNAQLVLSTTRKIPLKPSFNQSYSSVTCRLQRKRGEEEEEVLAGVASEEEEEEESEYETDTDEEMFGRQMLKPCLCDQKGKGNYS